MATYNGAEYVVEQLESIRTQSMPVDEVIIHDDRSTDDTVAIVEKYIREHGLERTWKVSQNPKNLGYAANFIGAVKETEGEYIFFCDQGTGPGGGHGGTDGGASGDPAAVFGIRVFCVISGRPQCSDMGTEAVPPGSFP